jgi:hypothetical protein
MTIEIMPFVRMARNGDEKVFLYSYEIHKRSMLKDYQPEQFEAWGGRVFNMEQKET